MLGAAFPRHPVDEPTVQLYVAALGAPPFYDVGVLTAAVGNWVQTEDWYPTVHQLVEAYQTEARRRARARQAADEARALAAGTLPGLPRPLGADTAIEVVDVVRTALAEAVGTGRRHSGHDRPGGCPTCADAEAISDRVEARVHGLLAERGVQLPSRPLVTYVCGHCLDTLFELVGDDPLQVAPCRSCQPVGYERWLGGHLAPGHWCGECDPRRRP